MSYRVETASSARATCKNTECKNAGIKIGKDELRLGTWVEINGNGSWQWRHWGCVSGKILENIRNNLEGEGNEGSGVYRWDYLDGLYGEEKNSLDKNPDLQEKVKRVITQGFIDPEDWNGDPEMNKLGEKGTRTAESKKKARADKIAQKKESEDMQAQGNEQKAENEALRSSNGGPAPKKAASKKRAKKDDSDDEEEDFGKTEKPAKKKRATKAKKEEDEDDDLAQAKPAPKPRAKKSMKEEEDSEVELPANKSRVKKRESVDSSAPSIGNDWSKLSVSELKEELEKRKLPKSGKKSDLIARLEENEAEAEPSSPVKAKKKENKDSKRIKNEDFEDRAIANAPSSATVGTNIRSSPPNIPLAKAQKSDPKTVIPGKAAVDSDTDDPISSVPVPKASKGKAARKTSAPDTKSSTAPAPKIRRGRSNA